MSAAASARSYLFVPANRPDRYIKALSSGADAVIVDLEDAVAPSLKTQARDTLADWLAQQVQPPANLWIRINAADTPWHADDVRCFAAASAGSIAGIVLPKAEDCDAIRAIGRHFTGPRSQSRVLALIETAAGIARMRQIAQAENVGRLVFGSIDLQVDLGIQCEPLESELSHLRIEMVIASRLANIAQPVDGVTTSFDDVPFLAAAVSRARRTGFGAKLCIHPLQVEVVNQGFLPSEEEIAWARAVMDAVAKSDGGAISLNGKMIDKPVIMQAERFLQQNRQTSDEE
ncbi:HpcH/HpaI aldolase/citrate lyase family protein [Herbaspirillum rhizosphaerae]|uniref:HpcH/HpaI aldolase/citrate lyase family protein n=1 Tax=Herbaspirillum rhizosphaerae TaxID=346179 RepID=UPI00067D786D|nr:CoA ester lyase [Herbaspirillum rhizosphaerae]